MQFKDYSERLYKTALLTSPLIGLMIVTPVLLYIESLPPEKTYFIEHTVGSVSASAFFVSLHIFLQWLISILLFQYSVSAKATAIWKKSWLRNLLSYLIIYFYVAIVLVLTDTGPLDLSAFEIYPYIGSFVSNSVILIMINLIITQVDKGSLELEKARLQINELKQHQDRLKQQMHPHFLFNALGTLHGLILKDSEKSAQYVEHLAKYLRKSISLSDDDLIPIKKELKFIENYFYLQRLRFSDLIKLEVHIPEDISKQGRLPVFSLQILVENAIKHNSFSKDIPLCISIRQEEHYLLISNNKTPLYTATTSTGHGLKNLTARFQSFTTEVPLILETEETFTVKLKILDL